MNLKLMKIKINFKEELKLYNDKYILDIENIKKNIKIKEKYVKINIKRV